MIRINLLAFRAARKRETTRKQFSIFFLTVIFLLILMPVVYLMYSNRLGELKSRESKLRSEYTSYAKITREIARIKKRTAEIKTRLDVMKELEKQRSGPVQLLEQIALSVPTDRLWLRSVVEDGGNLTLEGNAMDNDTVAAFMTNLEDTEIIQSVDLKSTKLQNFASYKINASDFTLTCKLASRNEAPGANAKAGQAAK